MTKVDAAERRSNRRVELDAAALAAPIAGGGAGPDLHDAPDSPFSVIEEARRQDDGLDQGVWVHDRKSADWNAVLGLCQEVLALRSKDLRVAAWMAEAWVQRDGFAALAPALDAVMLLCRNFWTDLHPLPDETGDLDGRINAMVMLNSRLSRALRTRPITQSGFTEIVRLSWGDYETARLQQTGGSRGGAPALTAFQDSAAATPPALLQALRDDVRRGRDALEALDEFNDGAFGRDAPALTGLKRLLEDIAGWVAGLLPQDEEDAPEPQMSSAELDGDQEMTASESAAGAAPGLGAVKSASGPISSRDEAYRRLAEVVDYLMRIEPHSPAPYVLRRVLAWGRMPLDQVLIEMAGGRNDLTAILELMAVKSD